MTLGILQYLIIVATVSFCLWFFIKRIELDKKDRSSENDFWEKETAANFTRRKDMNSVKYISIPFDSFYFGQFSDNDIKSHEENLLSLKDKKILNLTGKTSTDLKLEYGPANLSILDECDENFVTLVKELQAYADALYTANHKHHAKSVLEYAVEIGSDIKSTYTLLADIYVEDNETSKINNLIASANNLDSLMKKPIIASLSEKL